jgi:hypothetical protein
MPQGSARRLERCAGGTHIIYQQYALASKAVSLAAKGVPNVGTSRLGIQVHLWRRRSGTHHGILDDGELQTMA